MSNKNYTYAEVLILGPCSCKCFYCLGKEMPKASKESQLYTDFKDWKNFDEFIIKARSLNIKKVYVSSVNSDPLLYKHIYDLIVYLKKFFEYVGIRCNAANLDPKTHIYRALDECTEEISISLNSCNEALSQKIAGEHAKTEFFLLQFYMEREQRINANLKEKYPERRFRVSIVVNRYNVPQIESMLDYLAHIPLVSYVQLRRVYKYADNDKEFLKDQQAFDILKEYIETVYTKVDEYKGSPIYEYESSDFSDDEGLLKVRFSLWEDVFPEDEIRSFNYYTSGLISSNRLLVPGFEEQNTF